MKQRLLLIGPHHSGKTILANQLEMQPIGAKQRENLVYGKRTINAPSAYLECPWMHSHLIATQQDALGVLMLLPDRTRKRSYPPYFAQSFRVPVYGILTYDTRRSNEPDFEKSILEFEQAGVVAPYYELNLADETEAQLLWQQLTSVRKEELK